MKKVLVLSVGALLAMSSCGTYTGAGAYTGATLGSILGSAIGGISDGYRGSNLGTIIGMAGGAIIGGAIGQAKDEADRREVHDRYEQIQRRKANERAYQDGYQDGYQQGTYQDESGYDPTHSGDDRLYDFRSNNYTGDYSASEPRIMNPEASSVEELAAGYSVNDQLEIRNARFVDDNRDNILRSGEISKVIFEVVNTSNHMFYDIQPTVVEASGNKRIYISPSIHVERLAPGKAIRYTAMVKAGKLKDGTATFCLSVLQGNRRMSKVSEFSIQTRR